MDKLIDFLNTLAEKYKFDESDVKKIQELVFAIESPDGSEDADMNAEDFVVPEEDEGGYIDGDEAE